MGREGTCTERESERGTSHKKALPQFGKIKPLGGNMICKYEVQSQSGERRTHLPGKLSVECLHKEVLKKTRLTGKKGFDGRSGDIGQARG